MSKEEQIEKIIRWLRTHSDEEEAYFSLPKIQEKEGRISANEDGLKLFAAAILEASLELQQKEYIQDIDKEDDVVVLLPGNEWMKPEKIEIGHFTAQNDEETEEEEEEESNPAGISPERIFTIILIVLVLTVLFVLFIGMDTISRWFK